MRKFVIAINNKAERVVCCEDPSVVDLNPEESLFEITQERKIRRGDPFHYAIPILPAAPVEELIEEVIKAEPTAVVPEQKSSLLPYVGAGLAAASAAAYYLLRG